MSTLQKAIEIATRAHAGQSQKHSAGDPYITHPLAVMQMVSSMDARIVAVLHDVIEDTSVTAKDLRDAGFSERIVRAVEILTRRAEESYADSILRCTSDPLALEVKLADQEHNFLLSRVIIGAESLETDMRRLARRAASYCFLKEAMSREEFLGVMSNLESQFP
jgi:(p)ppGpp synthase/HD superfamily hydrolase